MPNILCPCRSNKLFTQCCQPYLLGIMLPETPVALMRSRYCAYTQQNADYLLDTWYLADQQNRTELYQSITESFQQTEWTGLKILRTGNNPLNPSEGFVEFMAYFIDKGHQEAQVIYERSRFLSIDQRWFYIDGIKPRIERNALCPCGSGKKYKKCCY